MFVDLVSGVTFFVAIVLALVALVLLARHWLSPQGATTMTVNGTGLSVALGRNLLRALGDHEIHLPSPCGGRGLCGQCKVTIVGADEALPTETGHLTRTEVRRGVRLACSNKVRGPLEVRVPESLLGAQRRRCGVERVRHVSTFLREVTLKLPDGERAEFEAGQYVVVEAPPYSVAFSDFDVDEPYRNAWAGAGLFELKSTSRGPEQRAYSLANGPIENDRYVLVVRIAIPPPGARAGTPPGVVSSFIFSLGPGDEVDVLGPYGEFTAHDSDREMLFVAGGAGIAPIRSIILDQLHRARSGRRMTFWYGARAVKDICYADEFDALAAEHENFAWHVALSAPEPVDDWHGSTGFIHSVVLERYLASHPAPEDIEYYLCGPPVMSQAVTQMLEDLGVDRSSIFFDDFGSPS